MKKSEFSERIQALLDQTLEEGSPSRAVATNKTKTLKPKHDAWYRTAEGRIIRICDHADKNLPFVGGDQDGEAKSYTKDGTPFGNDPDWRLVEEINSDRYDLTNQSLEDAYFDDLWKNEPDKAREIQLDRLLREVIDETVEQMTAFGKKGVYKSFRSEIIQRFAAAVKHKTMQTPETPEEFDELVW